MDFLLEVVKKITNQTPDPPPTTQMDTWEVQNEVSAGKNKCDSLTITHTFTYTHTHQCMDFTLILLPISLEHREQKTLA